MKTAPPQETTTLLYHLAGRVADRYPQRIRDDFRQEAVIAGMRALEHFEPNRGSLRAFLVRCMRNHLHNIARKENRTVYATVPLEDHHAQSIALDEPVEYTVELVQLKQMIASLPAADQTLLREIYGKNRTQSDVAAQTGCTKQAVQQRHARIVRTLRAQIQPLTT